MVDFNKLDRTIHEKGRLAIMTLLATRSRWPFQELKNALQMTVLVVTHELQSAFRIADRLAFLRNRKLVAIGPKDSITQSTDPWVRQFLDRLPDRTSNDKTELLQQLAERLGVQCPKN